MITKYKSKINTNINKDKSTFKTADFILSSFLLYSGLELKEVVPVPDDRNKNKKVFVFVKTDQLDELLNVYISSDPTVRLKKFTYCQKELKAKIYV